ncbi:MAG TPA: hypothetical protein DCS12_11680 [Clostridiales bacterium]|nr:hypothetical protein [Clostridiales bacterium]
MSIKDDYKVRSIPSEQTYEWLLKKHYAHRIPSISYAFGLYDKDNILQGVCTFGTPASSTLLSGICGVAHANKVIELNRLVLNAECPTNSASYFISRCLKLLPHPKIVVSYADSGQGHTGYVYQSCNFIYTGLSSKFLDPKVKGLENQHHATYAHGLTNEQLREKYGDKLYYAERNRKHRYIYFVGCSELKSELKYPVLPYPKGDNKRYDASYKPQVQGVLF